MSDDERARVNRAGVEAAAAACEGVPALLPLMLGLSSSTVSSLPGALLALTALKLVRTRAPPSLPPDAAPAPKPPPLPLLPSALPKAHASSRAAAVSAASGVLSAHRRTVTRICGGCRCPGLDAADASGSKCVSSITGRTAARSCLDAAAAAGGGDCEANCCASCRRAALMRLYHAAISSTAV